MRKHSKLLGIQPLLAGVLACGLAGCGGAGDVASGASAAAPVATAGAPGELAAAVGAAPSASVEKSGASRGLAARRIDERTCETRIASGHGRAAKASQAMPALSRLAHGACGSDEAGGA